MGLPVTERRDDVDDGCVSVNGCAKSFVLWLLLLVVTVLALFVFERVAEAHDDGDPWARVRQCESHDNYAINTGNGFFGAYQFTLRTWAWVAPSEWASTRPDLAPAAVQDAAAETLRTIDGGGLSHWPVCGRLYGGARSFPARSGHFGRLTDEHHECDVDGHGAVRVVRRASTNLIYVDAENDGDRHDIALIGFGRRGDEFACFDVNGDGRDDMVVTRNGVGTFWRSHWSTGTGQTL